MERNKKLDELPDWMLEKTVYEPVKGRDGFLAGSMLRFMKLFRHFHMEGDSSVTYARAGMRLLLCLGVIVMLALSHNLFYSACVAAGFLLYLSFQRIEVIKRVISSSFSASLFTLLVMLPAYFAYGSDAFITITIKVFLSVGSLALLTGITPWNKITASLRMIRIPNVVIFILDMTIHYILLLGNIAFEMLEALKVRSIGRNRNKKGSFSGILGTVFLKATEMSEETRQAMECRLFNGNYERRKETLRFESFIPSVFLLIYIVLLLYLR